MTRMRWCVTQRNRRWGDCVADSVWLPWRVMDIYWPSFDDNFLADLSAALKKRRKALKHKSRLLNCERLIESDDGVRTEKMELDIQLWTRNRLKVHAWSDRWLWVDARAPTKKGWAWEWDYDGRLLGPLTGTEVIGAIEETIDGISGAKSDAVNELTGIWQKLLARGPEEVR